MALRSALKAAGFAGLCGLLGYSGVDAVESALLFRAGSRLLLEHAEGDAELQQQLGPPVHVGKWYNAAVGVRPGGAAADCSMELSGSERTGKANLQMSRKPSQYHSILLYHLLGPGEWNSVAVNTMVSKDKPGSKPGPLV